MTDYNYYKYGAKDLRNPALRDFTRRKMCLYIVKWYRAYVPGTGRKKNLQTKRSQYSESLSILIYHQ